MEHINHLINEIKLAKSRNRVLLLEGGKGQGKGTALNYWIAEEGLARPAFILSLSSALKNASIASSSFGDLTVLTSSGMVYSAFI
jgi:hypothetical protein